MYEVIEYYELVAETNDSLVVANIAYSAIVTYRCIYSMYIVPRLRRRCAISRAPRGIFFVLHRKHSLSFWVIIGVNGGHQSYLAHFAVWMDDHHTPNPKKKKNSNYYYQLSRRNSVSAPLLSDIFCIHGVLFFFLHQYTLQWVNLVWA